MTTALDLDTPFHLTGNFAPVFEEATRAARSLGISRQMLQRKIREYGLRDA